MNQHRRNLRDLPVRLNWIEKSPVAVSEELLFSYYKSALVGNSNGAIEKFRDVLEYAYRKEQLVVKTPEISDLQRILSQAEDLEEALEILDTTARGLTWDRVLTILMIESPKAYSVREIADDIKSDYFKTGSLLNIMHDSGVIKRRMVSNAHLYYVEKEDIPHAA